MEIGANRGELARMLSWIQARPVPREVAVEGAKGFGRALTLLLLAAGEEVIDVPTHLTAQGRRTSRRGGKDDEGDAIIIARVAVREPNLPRMDAAHLDADMKLLVDARDQLVQEQIRVRNRLHALLIGLSPGHQAVTGALTSRAAVKRARQLAMAERTSDPVRAHLALVAIRRLGSLEKEIAELGALIASQLDLGVHEHLLAIPGVGPLTAAKILGETHDARHFPQRPRSQLTPAPRPSLRAAEHHPAPARPWREPAAQPRPVHNRPNPGAMAPRCAHLPGAQTRRRQERGRSSTMPETPPRCRRVPSHDP